MKKYSIIQNMMARVSVEVLADTVQDALKKACSKVMETSDYSWTIESSEVIKEEEVPSLEGLIELAGDIIRITEKQELFIFLDPWPKITIESWDGKSFRTNCVLVESVFWDECNKEIGIYTDCNSIVLLSELPDIEQMEICNSIIKCMKTIPSVRKIIMNSDKRFSSLENL